MLTKTFRTVLNLSLLVCIAPFLTLSGSDTAKAQNTQILEVPIKSVSINKQDERLQLWIEGDRLNGCDLTLNTVQKSREIKKGVTEVRIRFFHEIAAGSKCTGRYVPFNVPLNVQQAIKKGQTYRINVNDYNFVLKN